MTSARPACMKSLPSTLPTKPGILAQQVEHDLAQLVALALLLAVREQADGRLLDVRAGPGVLAAHAGELDEPLGRGVDGGAGVDQDLRVVTGHRDGHRDRGTGDALDAAHAQQRGGHRRAGVARADHRVGLAVAHRLRAHRTIDESFVSGRTAAAGSSSIAIDLAAVEDLDAGGHDAVREVRDDVLVAPDEQDPHVQSSRPPRARRRRSRPGRGRRPSRRPRSCGLIADVRRLLAPGQSTSMT